MSQSLIEQIEKAIKKLVEENMNGTEHLSDECYYERAGYSDGFKAGAQFILPLLKKAIEQRDESIQELVNRRMFPKKTANEILEIAINIGNKELLHLLGDK